MGECFIAEEKPLSPTRQFNANVPDLGIIITKKDQAQSLRHLTAGANVLDLSTIQNGAIQQIMQTCVRDIKHYNLKHLMDPMAFVKTWCLEFKNCGPLLEEKLLIPIKQAVDSVKISSTEKITVNYIVNQALKILNGLDRSMLYNIVLGRQVIPLFNSNKVTFTGNQDNIIDLIDTPNFISRSFNVSSVKRKAVELYKNDFDISELFKQYEADKRCVVMYSHEVGCADQPINCMTADDFKTGETRLVVQKLFWLQDNVAVVPKSVFKVNRVSLSCMPNEEGVLLVGQFYEEDNCILEDTTYLSALGQLSLRHKLFLKTTIESADAVLSSDSSFDPTPPESFATPTASCSSSNSSTVSSCSVMVLAAHAGSRSRRSSSSGDDDSSSAAISGGGGHDGYC